MYHFEPVKLVLHDPIFLTTLCRSGVAGQVASRLQHVMCPFSNFSRNISRLAQSRTVLYFSTIAAIIGNHCQLQPEIATYNLSLATCIEFFPAWRYKLQGKLHCVTLYLNSAVIYFCRKLPGVSRGITKYRSNQYVSCWKQWRTDELVDVLCPSGAYEKVF